MPSSLPASPACVPRWWLGGSSTPWLSPLPAPLVTGQDPACTIPGRFQPLALFHPTHPPHLYLVHRREHPHQVGVRAGPASPSSQGTMRVLPGLGGVTGLPISLGVVQTGVSSLRKRGFGEIWELWGDLWGKVLDWGVAGWVGLCGPASGCIALHRGVALFRVGSCCIALCQIVVWRVMCAQS